LPEADKLGGLGPVSTGKLVVSRRMLDSAATCTQSGTLESVAKVVPVREFRTKLSELLGDVADRRDHVLVTRNGKPAAALVPIDEYEALEETAEILSDSATLAAIEAGLADLARGDTVTLDELRQELAQRRAAP
jgi:prevent-host-death family protein